MEAVEFRFRGGVVEYRTLIVWPSVHKNSDGDEYDGPLDEHGYTEWRPLPSAEEPTGEQ
jgi:hypothetical protein